MDFKQISAIDPSVIIPSSGVPLIATKIRGFTPANLISFVDLTMSALENDPTYNLYETLYPSASGSVEYILPEKFNGYKFNSLLVTDRSATSSLVDFTLPLYYQYQFMYDSYIMDPSLPNATTVIRKNMESVVSFDNYVLEFREYPTASGRYNITTASGYLWSLTPASGNIMTTRALLPVREKDNFYTVEYNKYYNKSIYEYYNELIYEHKLYEEGVDYTITPSSIVRTSGSRLGSGVPIYVQRDPDSFITIKGPSFITDNVKEKPWYFQIKCGSFVHSSGLLGGTSNFSVTNYDTVASGVVSQTEIPKYINQNVIKLGIAPLYSGNAIYPSYDFHNTIISGTVNGKDLVQYVTSIDYDNGYVYLSKAIQPQDSISLNYTYDDSRMIISTNVDLNPRNSVSGIIDIANNAIGIAIVPSGTVFYDSSYLPISGWSNMAFYRLNDNITGNFDSIVTSGYAIRSVPDMPLNVPYSGVIPSGSILFGIFTLNSLSSNMVNITDIRRTGGYDASDVMVNCSGWRGFSDIGFWDGEAFPTAGTILIQIPRIVLDNIIQIFTLNKNYQATPMPYSTDLTRIIEGSTAKYESIEQQIDRDVRKYIRDTVERYLPVGTFYIIVDENFNPWPSLGSL